MFVWVCFHVYRYMLSESCLCLILKFFLRKICLLLNFHVPLLSFNRALMQSLVVHKGGLPLLFFILHQGELGLFLYFMYNSKNFLFSNQRLGSHSSFIIFSSLKIGLFSLMNFLIMENRT